MNNGTEKRQRKNLAREIEIIFPAGLENLPDDLYAQEIAKLVRPALGHMLESMAMLDLAEQKLAVCQGFLSDVTDMLITYEHRTAYLAELGDQLEKVASDLLGQVEPAERPQ